MKKPLSEEKTDLRQEIKILSLFFIIIYTNLSYSQIPLNGFGKLNIFEVDSAFNRIASINLYNDNHSNLILFNNFNTNALLLTGIDKPGKTEIKKFKLPLPVSRIENLQSRNNSENEFAVLSRRERMFAVVKLTTSGSMLILHKINFSSYPSYLSIADVTGYGLKSALISGSNFRGLSVLDLSDNKISEKKIDAKSNFSFARFADLNDDGMMDIAAYNLQTGNIHFYYNNGEGDFSEVRQISSSLNATQFKTFLQDSYSNLIVSFHKSIKIFYGDFRSAYDSTITITAKHSVDDFITGDFNNDGIIDIIYLSRESGIISTIFGKGDGTFYPEIVNLKRNKIEQISACYTVNNTSAAYVTSSGEAGIISAFENPVQNYQLALSAEASVIQTFDIGLNGITDFIFIDSWNNSLNAVERNQKSFPQSLYSFALLGSHENIVVDDSDPFLKRFYCYAVNARLIEIITYDFRKNEFKREQLYSPGSLLDLKISKKNGDLHFYIAFNKNKHLFAGKFSYHNIRYLFSEQHVDKSFLFSPEIVAGGKPHIFYWGMELNYPAFIKANLYSNVGITEVMYSLNEKPEMIISASKKTDENNTVIANLISSNNRLDLLLAKNDAAQVTPLSKHLNEFRIKNKNQLSFSDNNSLFLFDDLRKSLYRIKYSNNLRVLQSQIILKNVFVESFVIKNLDGKKMHLIFANSKNGSLSVRQIDE